MRARAAALLAASIVLAVGPLAPAHSAIIETVPASGTFSFTTGNGILPTWASEDIVLVGVSPGSVVTASSNLVARVTMPIVAKTGSANAAAGGFRLNNVITGSSVRCSSPTIDTRARLVDCVLGSGINSTLFRITEIRSRSQITGSSTVTTIYRGVKLKITSQKQADYLNDALGTTAFSPYVTIGTGDLIVTRDR